MHIFGFPPKQKATVLGESIEYICVGEGCNTIVLVNGAGMRLEAWHRVVGPLSTFAKVFAYNRPGIGKSSKPSVPMVGSRMVTSLRLTLLTAGLSPPYVLVGHSLGGLIVNLYARLNPSEVKSVVLLEATSPEDLEECTKHENGFERFIRRFIERLAPSHPNGESQHITSTLYELKSAPPFPAIPLIVVTGGKPDLAWARSSEGLVARAANQRALVTLSPIGKHIIATRSGHFPQLRDSEAVVAVITEAANQTNPADARMRAAD